jgi:malonate transporter
LPGRRCRDGPPALSPFLSFEATDGGSRGLARRDRDGVLAVVMFPTAVLMQELDPSRSRGSVFAPRELARHVILNPRVLSTLVGVAWAAAGVPMPRPLNAYFQILAGALTACALFAIGLGVSMESLSASIGRSAALAGSGLASMPLIVLGLSIGLGLKPLYLIAAVVCAAVSTAKTVYVLSGEYRCEEPTVAATISLTTLCSIGTLMAWMYVLARLFPLA